MRPITAVLLFVLAHAAFPQSPQSPSASPMLDTGLPNLYYPTPPPPLANAANASPLLNSYPPAGDPPSSGPCAAGYPPCVLTSQYNNARTDVNGAETVLTVALARAGPTAKAQFLVEADGGGITNLPPGFAQNPVYAQPLYVSNLTVNEAVHNVVYIAALNGEVYAYDGDNLTSPITPLWNRDETNVAGMQGLKHNCDTSYQEQTYYGTSVVGPIQYLDFAGVISTPVIEVNAAAHQTALYVVNECERTSPVDTTVHWYLTSLSITTGATLGSTEILYTSGQVGDNPYGPGMVFFAAQQLQRASLTITAGQVNGAGPTYRTLIAEFGTSTNETGFGTKPSGYQGWMFAYDTTNATSVVSQANTLPYIDQCYYPPDACGGVGQPACTPLCSANTSNPSAQIPNPCGDGGGVWMSNRGGAANTSNQVFSVAGNGGFNYCPTCAHHCAGLPPAGQSAQKFTAFGEAVLQVSLQNVWATTTGQAPFWPTDYFVPYNIPSGVNNPDNLPAYFEVLNNSDWDMGVCGVLLFNDDYLASPDDLVTTSMALTCSKRGDGYVMQQSSLGQFTTGDQGVVAEFSVAASNPNCSGSSGSCDETRTVAYWDPEGSDGFLVAWPWHETLESFQWVLPTGGSQYTFEVASTTSDPFADIGTGGSLTGYAGGVLAVTANPNDTSGEAVVWAAAFPYNTPTNTDPYDPSGVTCSRLDGRYCVGVLFAYSLNPTSTPTPGALTMLWPTPLPTTPDFEPAPYAIPLAVNGKVYAPAYGLYSGAGAYAKSGVQVYAF